MREGQDGRKFVVFVSDECHYSCTMAANVLGLGYDNLVKVDVDESGCMDTADLDRRVQEAKKAGKEPLAVIGTSGTTVRGAFDDCK